MAQRSPRRSILSIVTAPWSNSRSKRSPSGEVSASQVPGRRGRSRPTSKGNPMENNGGSQSASEELEPFLTKLRQKQASQAPSLQEQLRQRRARRNASRQTPQNSVSLDSLPPLKPSQSSRRGRSPSRRHSGQNTGQNFNPNFSQNFNPNFNPNFNQPSNLVQLSTKDSRSSSVSHPDVTAETPQQLPSLPIQPQSKLRRSRSAARSAKRSTTFAVYGVRLLVLGVGIGVISGTVLSVLNSFNNPSNPETNAQVSAVLSEADQVAQKQMRLEALPLALQLNQEVESLKQQVSGLISSRPDLDPGILMVDLDTGAYLDINSQSVVPAASTIKVPILVAFFQAIDAGQIRLDEKLTLEQDHIASGSGDLQYQSVGSSYSTLEVASKMIVISDNTATNMLIERLGGAKKLNQKFANWGLKDTGIKNPLPDLKGTNTTTPRDLVNLLTQINQGKLVSMKSRDRIFNIMEQTENDALIPSGLGPGAIAAHKTGNLKSVSADIGLIDMPSGKRYLLAALVKRPDNDPTAETLIQAVSGLIYKHFQQDSTKIQPEQRQDQGS
ncbi:MAG: serine hydrolase [Microcoleaceae cyanobacterium]